MLGTIDDEGVMFVTIPKSYAFMDNSGHEVPLAYVTITVRYVSEIVVCPPIKHANLELLAATHDM